MADGSTQYVKRKNVNLLSFSLQCGLKRVPEIKMLYSITTSIHIVWWYSRRHNQNVFWGNMYIYILNMMVVAVLFSAVLPIVNHYIFTKCTLYINKHKLQFFLLFFLFYFPLSLCSVVFSLSLSVQHKSIEIVSVIKAVVYRGGCGGSALQFYYFITILFFARFFHIGCRFCTLSQSTFTSTMKMKRKNLVVITITITKQIFFILAFFSFNLRIHISLW